MLSAYFVGARSALFNSHEEKAFLAWMRETNNMYVGDEFHFRLGVFAANNRRVKEFNRAATQFTLCTNKLAALTNAEYQTLLGHKQMAPVAGEAKVSNLKFPEQCDWREKANVVNAVKDQGSCGSCWAFSVIHAMESQWGLKKGQLPILSEQNLVDCCTACYGCNGGDEYITYDYVIQHQGGLWMKEEDYPYTARDGSCKFDKTKGVCPVKSYFRPTTTQNEDELAAACAESGCVSIAVDAGGYEFQMYAGGIFNPRSCSSTRLNHAVGLVGYGAENGTPYWIVRNSWGSSWGENGYIRIIRNNHNKCGVATDVIIPQVE